MPKKVCPDCGKEYGVRKLICDCGHDFACKRSGAVSPLYPEPGAWVADSVKGLPPITPPEVLQEGSLDNPAIKEIISFEGLGYALYSYIPDNRVEDLELRKLWRAARLAMLRIVEHLG